MALTNTRHERILALAAESAEVRVGALADRLAVSAMTIRRDLQALEAQGKLTRVHGGAVLPDRMIVPPAARARDSVAEKRTIARLAARYVEPGMDVFLGAGSTAQTLAERLAEGPAARYATNCLYVAEALGAVSQQDIHVFGGALWRSAGTFVGPETIEMIERRRFDRVLVGIDAIDTRNGLFEPTEWQAWLLRTLRQRADQLVVLADHGKFAQKGDYRVLGLDALDVLVTDRAPADDHRMALNDAGVALVYAT